MERKEVNVFDLSFFAQRYWAIPMKEIRHRGFRKIFRLFQQLLPDHPNEENTVLYILENQWGNYNLLWTCDHFEHDSSLDLARLRVIAEELGGYAQLSSEVYIPLLDGHREKLILEVYGVAKRTARSLIRGIDPQASFS